MRLNITLPDNLEEELRKIPNKSSYIAAALKEKIRKERQLNLVKELQAGYKATRLEDKEIDREWEKTTLKGWK